MSERIEPYAAIRELQAELAAKDAELEGLMMRVNDLQLELVGKDAKLAELEGIDQACDAANSHVLELEKELAELRAKLGARK